MINYTDMTKEESKRLCIKIDVLKEKLAILQKAWDKSPESVPLAEIYRCKAELRKAEQVYNNGEGVITDEEADAIASSFFPGMGVTKKEELSPEDEAWLDAVVSNF